MGSCVSKCRTGAVHDPGSGPNPHQDEAAVIAPPPAPSNPEAKELRRRQPPSHSSSSSRSSSTPSFSSSSRGTSTSASSSCSSSLSNGKAPPSTELFWSCAYACRNPHIVVLDPGKRFPAQTLLHCTPTPPFRPVLAASERAHQLKRARSRSPALARQKSSRTAAEAAPSRGRNITGMEPLIPPQACRRRSPSPSRRFANRVPQVPAPVLVPAVQAAGKGKVLRRVLSPPRTSGKRYPRFLGRREASMHQIHPQADEEDQVRNEKHDRSFRAAPPPMDEMANPQISLDCFIFL